MNNMQPTFPVLTTQRLSLRQPTMQDEKEIFALRSKRNPHLDRPVANTIDDARNFITKVNNNNNAVYWAITFINQNNLIGTICIFNCEGETCEIGFELLPDYQGQGIMKEAIEKVLDYAFKIRKAQKIIAYTHKDNIPSITLLEKCLFRNDPAMNDGELIYYNIQ